MNLSLQYIAGFLDGEGTISLIQCNKSTRTYLRPSISLYQNQREILEKVRNFFDRGRVYTRRQREHQNKPCSVWMVTGAKPVSEVLGLLTPELIIKKPQAELLLEFIEKKGSLSNKEGIEFSERIKRSKRK